MTKRRRSTHDSSPPEGDSEVLVPDALEPSEAPEESEAEKAPKSVLKRTPVAKEAVAKEAVAKESKDQTPAPPRVLPKVMARVFAQSQGVKPDQAAGFLAWVRRQGIGVMTIPEWKAAYKDFMGRPVS